MASWGPEIPAARLGQRSQSQLSEIEKGAATLTSPHCLPSPSLPSAGCPQALPRSSDALALQSLSAPLAQPEKLPNHIGRWSASPRAPKLLRVSTLCPTQAFSLEASLRRLLNRAYSDS